MSEENKQPAKPENPQPPQKGAKQPQRKLGLEIPKELNAVYSNAALIANTPAEMVIDFVQVLPRMTKGTVQARVIMSPMHAKLLLKALEHNVNLYEQQFGAIRVPHQTSLADQFFRRPKKDDDK